MTAAPEPWRPVCHRGEFWMQVMTRARADMERVVTHRDAEYVALLLDDSGPTALVNYLSATNLLEFTKNMAPRSLFFANAPGEDCAALCEQLAENVGRLLH